MPLFTRKKAFCQTAAETTILSTQTALISQLQNGTTVNPPIPTIYNNYANLLRLLR